MIPQLAVRIRDEARSWYARECRENPNTPNRGPCVDEIQAAYWTTIRAEPWCTSFVWVVVDGAARKQGVTNHLPKTAGALDLLNRARKASELVVDRTPEVGSIFYRRSTLAGVTGHTGIVTRVQSTGIVTVEGNSSNRVAQYLTPRSQVEAKANDYWFIHAERMVATPLVEEEPTSQEPAESWSITRLWPLAAIAGIGTLVFITQRRNNTS